MRVPFSYSLTGNYLCSFVLTQIKMPISPDQITDLGAGAIFVFIFTVVIATLSAGNVVYDNIARYRRAKRSNELTNNLDTVEETINTLPQVLTLSLKSTTGARLSSKSDYQRKSLRDMVMMFLGRVSDSGLLKQDIHCVIIADRSGFWRRGGIGDDCVVAKAVLSLSVSAEKAEAARTAIMSAPVDGPLKAESVAVVSTIPYHDLCHSRPCSSNDT